MLGRFLIAAGSRLLGVDLAAILASARDTADNIDALLPKERCDRCHSQSHYLIPLVETGEQVCHECMPKETPRIACQQECGGWATVYAMDSCAGGWGGYYCEPCAKALKFQVTDRL